MSGTAHLGDDIADGGAAAHVRKREDFAVGGGLVSRPSQWSHN